MSGVCTGREGEGLPAGGQCTAGHQQGACSCGASCTYLLARRQLPPLQLEPSPQPSPCLHALSAHTQTLLSQHGVVCVARAGSDERRLLDAPGSLLHTYRRNVVVVDEPVPNEISSSRVLYLPGSFPGAEPARAPAPCFFRSTRQPSRRAWVAARPCMRLWLHCEAPCPLSADPQTPAWAHPCPPFPLPLSPTSTA